MESERIVYPPEDISEQRKHIWTVAVALLGTRSVRYTGPEAGMEPVTGFDCSGYVLYVLRTVRKQGTPILFSEKIRHTDDIFDQLGMPVHEENVLPMDILVFTDSRGLRPTHCGFVLDRTHYIHAPGRDGTAVEIDSFQTETIRRGSPQSLYSRNPIGFKRLAIVNTSARFTRKPIP